MLKSSYLFLFFFMSFCGFCQTSQEEEDRSTFLIQLNQDNTFNFYPVIMGSIPLKKHDLTFYAISWTSPAFANPDDSGSLIEAGIGLGLTKGNLYINPSLGFAHGIFTNGRNPAGYGRPTFGDAIVPGIISYIKVWGDFYKLTVNIPL